MRTLLPCLLLLAGAALRAHAEQYGVDPERIGVWGSSAGGHLALMVGCADAEAGLEGKGGYARFSSRVAAVCSWFGPADLSVLATNGENAASQFLGGPQEGREATYRQASPVTHASADDPPVLMLHGDRDALVPLDQSERMLKALRAVGVEAELVVVKGAGHGWKGTRIEPGVGEILERTLAFFERELREGK